MSRFKLISITLLACAVAGFAFAQNADQNTSGPTRNDYRLHVIQPAEGATIIGNKIQVVVDTEIPGERDTKQDVNSMPRPGIDVFLDGKLTGTMRDEHNVVDIESVAAGPRTLILLARNKSGEIIDRKEIHIEMVAPSPAPVPAAAHPVMAPPPPKPAPPVQVYEPPPAPAPVAEPLPKTGTANPLLAVAGLTLLGAGLLVRRLS